MSDDRLSQKSDLHFKLGRLFGPLLDLIEHPDRYDEQDRAETLARYFSEYTHISGDFEKFCKGQIGHDYSVENHHFSSALGSVRVHLINKSKTLDLAIRECLPAARAAIDAIP